MGLAGYGSGSGEQDDRFFGCALPHAIFLSPSPYSRVKSIAPSALTLLPTFVLSLAAYHPGAIHRRGSAGPPLSLLVEMRRRAARTDGGSWRVGQNVKTRPF